jgi:hypothetical protein
MIETIAQVRRIWTILWCRLCQDGFRMYLTAEEMTGLEQSIVRRRTKLANNRIIEQYEYPDPKPWFDRQILVKVGSNRNRA